MPSPKPRACKTSPISSLNKNNIVFKVSQRRTNSATSKSAKLYQNACATLKDIEPSLFQTLVQTINARYSEGTPYCPEHESSPHTYTLQTSTKRGSDSIFRTALTVKLGGQTHMVTMTLFHTTATMSIQGAPNNVEVFIQDHIVPVFTLTNYLHVNITEMVSVTDLTIDTSLLCLSCSENSDLIIFSPKSQSANTQVKPPMNSHHQMSPPAIHNISTLSTTLLEQLNDESFQCAPPAYSVCDTQDESSIPCGQQMNTLVCEQLNVTTSDSPSISQTPKSNSKSQRPTYKTKSKPSLNSQNRPLTSTPVVSNYHSQRMDNLEALVLELSDKVHSQVNDITRLSGELTQLRTSNSRLSRDITKLEATKSCKCNCPVQVQNVTPASKSPRKKRWKDKQSTNSQDSSIPHLSPAYLEASATMSPLPPMPSSTSRQSADCSPPQSADCEHVSHITKPPTNTLSQPSIKIIGDSNLFGMKNMLHNAIPSVVVEPKSGATIASMQDAIVHSDIVDILVVAGGINDADSRDNPQAARDDIKKIISAARQKAGSVILAPPAPNPGRARAGIDSITAIMEEEAARSGGEVSCIPMREFAAQDSVPGHLFKDHLHLTKLGCGLYVKLLLACLTATYPMMNMCSQICPRCHHTGHVDCGSFRHPQGSPPQPIDVSRPPPPPKLMSLQVSPPECHPSIPWFRNINNYQTFVIPPAFGHSYQSSGYWAPF